MRSLRQRSHLNYRPLCQVIRRGQYSYCTLKPIVFLSHTKSDRSIVERLATDLRLARIDVWYDDWEIPPGESFRRQIFEEGIPKSDLFFVYLTERSIQSYWVARELDGAFIRDAEARGGFLAFFVDSD